MAQPRRHLLGNFDAARNEAAPLSHKVKTSPLTSLNMGLAKWREGLDDGE